MKRLVAATLLLAACGPEGRDPLVTNDGGPSVDAPVPTDGTLIEASRVYAHSRDGLYRLNTQTLTAAPIGVMAGLSGESLLDLAVDQNDRIVGISATSLWEIDATTGDVTLISTLAQDARGFTSLSFVPATNATDPDILVAANGSGAVFQFNELTGAATQIGSYGTHNGQPVGSSGDLFGVRGLGIYATVNVGTDPDAPDHLAIVDPANGWKATPLAQPTGFNKVFGLGFWGDKVYGFADASVPGTGGNPSTPAGKMIEINRTTGFAVERNAGAIAWFGAGVATDAPILQ